MNIKDKLEKRVKECTPYPQVYCQQRIGYFFWYQSDDAAENYCSRLMEIEHGKGLPVKIETHQSPQKILMKKVSEADEKLSRYEWSAPKGIYLLFIASNASAFSTISVKNVRQFFQNCQVEFLCIGKSIDAETAHNSSFTHWLSNLDNPEAAALLLFNATLSENLISPETVGLGQGKNIFKLEVRNYSAVREDICQRMLALLSEQMSPADKDIIENQMNQFNDSMEECRRNILTQCPWARLIPVTGYQELADELGDLFKRSIKLFFEKRKRNWIGKDTEYPIDDILGRLFGYEGDEPLTEEMRKRMQVYLLPELCQKEMVGERRNYIEDEMYRIFSLYDLNTVIPKEAVEKRKTVTKSMESIEKDIQECRKETFYTKSVRLADFYNGLNKYFDFWNDYIRAAISAEWWQKVSELVLSKREEIVSVLKNLSEALNVFRMSAIDSDTDRKNKEREESHRRLRSEKDIEDMLMACSSQAAFTEESIRKLREILDGKYANSTDYHSQVNRKPKIGWFVNDSLIKSETYIEYSGNFSWRIYGQKFLPRSLIYEIKIYPEQYIDEDDLYD